MNSLKKNKKKNPGNSGDIASHSVRVLSDIARKDIERSYNIDNSSDTEAYYSNRYGWTLRRSLK
ncbi:uncharacterized protein METZ01_LOCUS475949 [marine metagenome]|uniref:Uncharacterized protein n=1 Tax=marine metagenome TaxID=408172 RepID=A0A383BV15_9ZZZZ